MPDSDKDKHENEYALLLSLLDNLITDVKFNGGQWNGLEDLMYERADIALRHAFEGFGMSYEECLALIRNAEELTGEQAEKRRILLAAVDNICDFAVVEEYQMFEEMIETIENADDEEDDIYEFLLPIFKKYNHVYVWTENLDIEYAMSIAAALSKFSNNTELMYMTMGDERVRPWHLQYEGFTARKSDFPAWLIPPIEHGCRCFLVEAGTAKNKIGNVKDKIIDFPEMPDWFDKTFKESVALGGKIFSEEHKYFQVKPKDMDKLAEIASDLKDKYLKDNE